MSRFMLLNIYSAQNREKCCGIGEIVYKLTERKEENFISRIWKRMVSFAGGILKVVSCLFLLIAEGQEVGGWDFEVEFWALEI